MRPPPSPLARGAPATAASGLWTWAAGLARFGAAQASAAAFGIALLGLIVATRAFWPEDAALHRYDALLIGALLIQATLLLGGWETWEEARVILAFHFAGTVMEIFKTSVGSWSYPEAAVMQIAGVPLFSGFMYAAVGSYIARSWRLFDAELENAPPFWAAATLALASYGNFFTHHFVWDARWVLFAATAGLYWRTRVRLRAPGATRPLRPPLLLGFVALALLIWSAENVATWANIWLYPAQEAGWRPVSPAKIGSWFLLAILSFVLVAAAQPTSGAWSKLSRAPTSPAPSPPPADAPVAPRRPISGAEAPRPPRGRGANTRRSAGRRGRR